MRRTSIMLIAALAAVSAQATVITFDAPDYATGGLGGQDGWTASHSGNPIVFAGGTIGPPSTGNEMQVNDSTWAYRDFSSDIADITTFSMLISPSSLGGSLGGAHKELGLGPALGQSSHSSAYMWLWMDARIGNEKIIVNSGSTGAATFGNFVENDDYRFTATLNFATQTIDATLENLTQSTTDTLTGISFRMPTTLAAAQTAGGSNVSFDGMGNLGNMNFDDLSVIPEPATLGLLGSVGAGLLFIRRKFVL